MGASQSNGNSSADKRAIVLAYTREKYNGAIDFTKKEMIAIGDIDATRKRIMEFLGRLAHDAKNAAERRGIITIELFVPFVVTDEIAERIDSLRKSFGSYEGIGELQALQLYKIDGSEYLEGSMLTEVSFEIKMVSTVNSESVLALVSRISMWADIGHKRLGLVF